MALQILIGCHILAGLTATLAATWPAPGRRTPSSISTPGLSV